MYAKLINNTLVPAPQALPYNGQTVINPNDGILLALGYLPVQYTDPPEVDDGYYAAPRWTQTETAIVQEWAVRKDTRPLTTEEVTRLIIRHQVNSLSIDDATASRMVDYFPELTGDGSLVNAGTRINWHGTLKQAAVALWDTGENTPDAAPELWADIQYRSGYRIIPEAITVTAAFSDGEYGWWGDTLYRSTVNSNVYTPEQYPDNWEVVSI